MDERTFALLLALIAVGGTILGTLLGAWLQRRFQRDDEARTWGIELRRCASAMRLASWNYSKRMALAETVPGAPGTVTAAVREAAWRLWTKEIEPVEQNFFAYIDIVGFVDQDLRGRAATAFTRFEQAAKGTIVKHMVKAAEDYAEVLNEIILGIDRELGIHTATRQVRDRDAGDKP